MTFALIPKPPSDVEFLQVFNRLCVALREQVDPDGVTQGVYFDALKDLPAPAVKAGAEALMREPGRKFFPTTAEWRTAAEKASVAQLKQAIAPARDEPWHYDDEACMDTGWLEHACPGTDKPDVQTLCGRRKPHAAHQFVTVCPCRPTNRTYQRHHHFGAGE